MSQPIISVKNISKKYRLGSIGLNSFIDDLRSLGTKFGLPCNSPDRKKEFWALQNINFEVHEGEVLGLIGHNGAGKSTLLKILSRITEPTTGEAVLRGRVASLLEVGTGFHGEMTGRENIFLNGALYGLTKSEIIDQLDSIIDFSGVENFIDTPVKRYSSGMYVRLAFAVAVHLKPEILIIDEVLAVGDAGFQIKCVEKINSIRDSGRTVLFVSHNMDLIESLCSRGLLFKNGILTMDDQIQSVLEVYRNKSRNNDIQLNNSFRLHDTGQISFLKASLANNSKDRNYEFQIGEPIVLKLDFKASENLPRVLFSLKIHEKKFGLFGHASSIDETTDFYKIDKGEHVLEVVISSSFLPGFFFVTINAAEDSGKSLCCIENAISFEITRKGFQRRSDYLWTESCAPCFVQSSWKIASK